MARMQGCTFPSRRILNCWQYGQVAACAQIGLLSDRPAIAYRTCQMSSRVTHRFEAAWKDPECDSIYEHLRREMEIDRRYEALEDKVGRYPL